MVSCKIFATVVVPCKKQEQRETIVDDQQDMDISKATDAVVESEHVGGQLKTPNVSSLIFRERTLCSKCKIGLRCVHVWLTSRFLTCNPVVFPLCKFSYKKIDSCTRLVIEQHQIQI